jgi:formamidopyrimidine-DNA glycosylase
LPELPEVETIVRQLAATLPGSVIRAVTVLKPDLIEGESPRDFAAALKGRRVEGVTRRAKNIIIDTGGEVLRVNLGMTGRLYIPPPGEPLPSHLGVRLALRDGRDLLYQDVRRFGRLGRMSPRQWEEWSGAQGIEPLSDEFTARWLYDATRRSRVAIKVWLMDQKRVVGVGNIYASEALFRARIHPARPADELTRPQTRRLQAAVREVLREAIEFRGTTLLDYRDAEGERGDFVRRLRVYDREGEPCVVCHRPVRRVVQGGRSTFFCAHCQR